MAPAQPEIHRSGRTSLDPDHIETELEVGHRAPASEPGPGAVPTDNRPGHHPEHEQDKPDLDDFAARFGTAPHDAGDEATSPEGAMTDAESRAAADSGPDQRDQGGPSLPRTAWRVAETAVGAGEMVVRKVGGPVLGMVKGVLSRRSRPDAHGPSSSADADRIARLESRLADLERRVERQEGD